MKRMTHARCSGIKQGYWSPATKEELVQRLAQYENLDPDPEHLRERLERAEGIKCGRPGAIVHHKEHLTPQNINDPDITLSEDNLELLCLRRNDRRKHLPKPS